MFSALLFKLRNMKVRFAAQAASGMKKESAA